ncbi:MAG: SDR family NAD(P)-dependent oxidoreductase [Dehalococcoidia bacterium]|nr:SDR family NAD(P)-dependent oxidoreductase [Dehalococcoidia bacterium]MCA9830779.1 SDR family NAD(P)-dependent oxidoreductase [Dehalococcoidia bacterium]MCB9484504.1 SDR family NAD(P)-dependent oxidoreductase [Thermoflexaceae bacterium]
MNELNGKVAIVTGSSRGIGEAIARRFALAGAKVIVTARTVEVRDERLPGTVNSVADAIRAAGGEATAVPANLQKKEERERLVATAIETYGGVDVLVNNAAILVPGGTIDFDERYFDRMFEILVKAPFHLAQLTLPGMIERGGGSVLNISSGAAIHPKPKGRSVDGAVYGMTKAAIERFTTGLAAEMYANKISANALSPTLVVATPGQMFGRQYTQEMLDASEPVEKMAEAALALVTGDPAEVTGGIRYSQEVLDAFGLTPVDIGMAPPKPN